MKATLYYIHDPMCGWCFGFKRTLHDLVTSLPDDVGFVRLLGGLAADTDEPMPDAMRQRLIETWHRIESTIPGVRLNFDFWELCEPRRSTYPSCRAVIAARRQGDLYDMKMTEAIQHAYYQEARNPSDIEVLVALADEIGIDSQQFETDLASTSVDEEFLDEMMRAESMGAAGYPSLYLETSDGSIHPVAIDYIHADSMLEALSRLIE